MNNQQYEPHLYMICYPNTALVLSHLTPEKFSFQYSFGSASYYAGRIIFAEIDINYRNPYFKIDEALKKLKPHSDGRPKSTTYISSYRVLEHIEVSAVQRLHLVNADGTSYTLEPGTYEKKPAEQDLRIYAEITPVKMVTLSKYDLREFGRWFTSPDNILVLPRILYSQVNLNIDEFLMEFEQNPFMVAPIEGVHPSKLRDGINELRRRKDKFIKGITLDTAFTKESYRKIRHGFMLIDAENEKYFPMPSLDEIEKNNLKFWRNM